MISSAGVNSRPRQLIMLPLGLMVGVAVVVSSVWIGASTVHAFAPPMPFVSRTPNAANAAATHSSSSSSSSSTTALFISSWGASGPPHRWADAAVKENPETNVQAYLPEPAAVEARDNIDGTCLVSGLVRNKDRTDQFLFDLLNHEDSAFEYAKIVAFVDDPAFAKKRLLSRSARYTGLLDKLDFVQAASPGSLPTAEQLSGVKSWVAYLDEPAQLLSSVMSIAERAKQCPGLKNVAVLLANANELDASESERALQALKDSGTTYTVVVVGKLDDTVPEGREAYQYREFGTAEGVLPAKATFSRDESYRMVTELLQLECGANRALCFAEVYNENVTEVRLVKGLREAGYARPQEIDHMIRLGPDAYMKAIEEFKKENPDAAKGYTTSDAWWEREEFQKSRRRSAEREQEKMVAIQDERTKEVEAIAKEWAKREYFRQSMAGAVQPGVSEEEFIKSVWDRALFEGDLKYRQSKGETTDDEKELADFKGRQEKKGEVMLARAKKELKEILEKEDLGGDDLQAALDDDEDDDDDDDD
jgi:hypothetical protein